MNRILKIKQNTNFFDISSCFDFFENIKRGLGLKMIKFCM